MSERIYQLTTSYVKAQAAVVRSSASTSLQIQKAIQALGEEIGKQIVERYYLAPAEIQTPMKAIIRTLMPRYPVSVVITTKDDFLYFGNGIARIVDNCLRGYMDFEGRRGLQALDSPIRSIELPDAKAEPVDSLIVGKSVLATGCTAISLTKVAFQKYMPNRTIIAAAFYSQTGLRELRREFPQAEVFLIGEPDEIGSDGMLTPGVGNLDARTRGD